jgi:hypothetical protein
VTIHLTSEQHGAHFSFQVIKKDSPVGESRATTKHPKQIAAKSEKVELVQITAYYQLISEYLPIGEHVVL